MNKPINYPNRIADKHANDTFRQVIDSHNALTVAHDRTAADTAANKAAIAALPSSYLTPNDVNSQIFNSLGVNGQITSYIVTLLKASGVNVPSTLPPVTPPSSL